MDKNLGMFGASPEALQFALAQQQQQQDLANAQKWGGMGLGQQISTGAYQSGQMAGRAFETLGKGFGVLNEDPQVTEAKKLFAIKENIMKAGLDPQDIDKFYPEMIKQLYQGGMIDKAIALEKDYQKLLGDKTDSDLKLTMNREKVEAIKAAAAARAAGKPFSIQAQELAKTGKYTAASVAGFAETGDLSKLQLVEPEATWDYVGAEIGTNLPVMVNKKDPNGEAQVKENGKWRPAKGMRETRALNNNTQTVGGANIKTYDVVTEQATRHNSIVKPYLDKLRAADDAMEQYTIAGNNPAADKAFDQSFAALFKADGQMSKAEMEALINAGSLPAQVVNKLKLWMDGTRTQMSRDEKLAAVSVARAIAAKKAQKIREKWKASAKKNNLTDEDIDLILSSSDSADASPSAETPQSIAQRVLQGRKP